MYWTDWQTESIHKTNKFNGSAVSNVAISLFSPMDIHVFHELKQPKATPRCENNNGGCSHMCLPSPMITSLSARYTCACPNGWSLKADGRQCEGPPTTTKTARPDNDTTTDKNLGPNSSSGFEGKSPQPIPQEGMGKLAGIIAGSILGFVIVAVVVSNIHALHISLFYNYFLIAVISLSWQLISSFFLHSSAHKLPCD